MPTSSVIYPVFSNVFASVGLPSSLESNHDRFCTRMLEMGRILRRVGGKRRYFMLFSRLFEKAGTQSTFRTSITMTRILGTGTCDHFLVSARVVRLTHGLSKSSTYYFCCLRSTVISSRLVYGRGIGPNVSRSEIKC